MFTIKDISSAEFTEKKSKFIGYVSPCRNEAEAISFVSEIRGRHNDATHNCYAFQIGEKELLQRSSDDGEPAGTAGRPILEVIKNSGLTNIVIVVTRYFGGTLLGTGGLVKAYTQGAQIAIAASTKVEFVEGRLYSLSLVYPLFDKISRLIESIEGEMAQVQYTDRVQILTKIPKKYLPFFLAELEKSEMGSASAVLLDDNVLIPKEVE